MQRHQTLVLNTTALAEVPEAKRAIFVHEWLSYLVRTLPSSPRPDVKANQKTIVSQLTTVIQGSGGVMPGGPGPPIRELLGKCFTTLFSVGDTFLLFETINKCNDILKNKDDSPSGLPSRLAAMCVLGHMYETLGRMTGRSYEETVQSLVKGLKNAESQTRIETMITFGKVCQGLGTAASNVHRDVYKTLKSAMTSDRVMSVRAEAASALLAMAPYASFITTTELENVAITCYKALEGSNYVTRKAIARCLGNILALTQQNINTKQGMMIQTKKSGTNGSQTRTVSIDDVFAILMQGFLKGGSGSGLIKGTSQVNQEVRVGVAHCYVAFVQSLGSNWLEKHMGQFLNHVLELAAHPKANTSHVDAVYSRKCVGHIIQILLGKLLGEKAQMSACKELIAIVDKLINAVDIGQENTKDSTNAETLYAQHQMVVALGELGNLFMGLGTACKSLLQDNQLRIKEVLFSTLLHPCQAPRLAAAYTIRSLCVAVPSFLTPAIDGCLEGLEKLKSSAEAVSGYSGAIAAVLGSVRLTPLGIPHTRGKFIFNVGEELLRTASQNSRLSRERTQAGWLLIGSIMMLGPAVVKGLLPRMMLLWRNAFPRSPKEFESERSRGDAFTWKISLEARAGAMASIHAFLLSAATSNSSPNSSGFSELVNEDVLRRLTVPLEACLNLCANIGPVLKTYPAELKALAAMLRLRLYEALTLLPPGTLESNYTQLLRLLVAEFTLADGHSSTSTSLLRSLCHKEDSVILGTHFQDTEEMYVEEQLLANSASGSGALEHDICSLFRPFPQASHFTTPGPLPLGVSVIDQSIVVFGLIFPRVAQKHRLQMLQHFTEHIKQAQLKSKNNAHSDAVQLNIFTAVLSSLKGLVEAKAKFGGQEEVKKSAVSLIMGALTSSNPNLRCAAGEALGRMAQVVQDSKFVAEAAQTSFDCLKTARDVVSRTGHSLALGCLHRYVGGIGSSQHLHTSVSILLALAQDQASPEVQVWSLHALALIADSGGPMFRDFVEPTLATVVKLLLNVQASCLEVLSCLGRVLSALITTVGPELQTEGNSISEVRFSLVIAGHILKRHPHPVVQAEGISCLQQLHMFAQSSLGSDLASLVPHVCNLLRSPHLVLRNAAVSCLRQFAQREAREVCDIAFAMISAEGVKDTHKVDTIAFNDTGLPGILFSLLDHELDEAFLGNVQDTILFIMQSMAAENLSTWLGLLREVLTISSESIVESGQKNQMDDKDENNVEFEGDDSDRFTTGEEARSAIQPRWPTRVFAAQCLRKIILECCQGNRAHYDLGLAKEMQWSGNKGDYLVLHLSELVRVAFMAATSESDPLRLEGLQTLQVIIETFGETPEPEFPGHVILEQYQAQVGAALRPAFTSETPSHVTAAACDVCSAWISSGVARDLCDLRRVYQLLVSALDKMRPKQSQVYNESALTLEKLSILKGWAKVYVASMRNEIEQFSVDQEQTKTSENEAQEDADDDFGDFTASKPSPTPKEDLASLVQSELPTLSKYWLAALKDHALLTLPSEFKTQLPFDGGAFYSNETIESARPHYKATWQAILEAAAIWLSFGHGFDNVQSEKADTDVEGSVNLGIGPANAASSKSPSEINHDRFFLLFGICMEALSQARSGDMSREEIQSCLNALKALLSHSWCRKEVLLETPSLMTELCNVLHRTVLTRDNPSIQSLVLEVLQLVLMTSKDKLNDDKRKKRKEMQLPANAETKEIPELDMLGEGRENGELEPGRSVVFSTLEVCLCVLVRFYPELSQRSSNLNTLVAIQAKSRLRGRHLTEEQNNLVAMSLKLISALPSLCSPPGALKILPSILWLTTGVLKEAAVETSSPDHNSVQISASLHGIKTIASSQYAKDSRSKERWTELLQSAMLRVLDMAKTAPDSGASNEAKKPDEVSLILAVGVFVLHCDAKVVGSPNVQYPAINAFMRCLQSQDVSVRLRCVQTLRPIFIHEDKAISVPFIRGLLPTILNYLLDEDSHAAKSESELRLTLECIQLVEVTTAAIDESGKRTQLLGILIPVLISHLIKQHEIKESSQLKLKLSELALAKLTKLGQGHPQEFKEIMAKMPELKSRLEDAVLASQTIRQQTQRVVQGADIQQRKIQEHKPSIKLTMDFSNFK